MNWPRLGNSSKVLFCWFSIIAQAHQCKRVQSVGVKIAESQLFQWFSNGSCDFSGCFDCLNINFTAFVTLRFVCNVVSIANKETQNIWFVSCPELRLRQSVFEPQDGDLSCSYTSGQQEAPEHQPTLEETVESLFRRLREKRRTLGLPDNTKVRITIRTTSIAK